MSSKLAYFTQYNALQLYPFSWAWHNFTPLMAKKNSTACMYMCHIFFLCTPMLMDSWLVSHLGCCEQGSRNPDEQKSMLTQLPFCLHPGESLGFNIHRCPWENCPLIIWVKGPVYFAANMSLELLGAEGMAQRVSPHRHLLPSPKIWVQPLEPM